MHTVIGVGGGGEFIRNDTGGKGLRRSSSYVRARACGDSRSDGVSGLYAPDASLLVLNALALSLSLLCLYFSSVSLF